MSQCAVDFHIDTSKYVDMNKNYSRAIPAQWRHMAKVFEALGDTHRQRLVLSFEPGEHLNVGQLAEVSTLSRSTVSHHLKVLREAGVLDSEKIGKEVYFWVNKAFLQSVFGDVADYLHSSL
jgi:predicted transcriptional regulator